MFVRDLYKLILGKCTLFLRPSKFRILMDIYHWNFNKDLNRDLIGLCSVHLYGYFRCTYTGYSRCTYTGYFRFVRDLYELIFEKWLIFVEPICLSVCSLRARFV